MARANPSCIMTLSEVDGIIDRIRAKKPVDPISLWNTGILDAGVWTYSRDRWPGRGITVRTDALERKIMKISKEVDVENHPDTIWLVKTRAYYTPPLCYMRGGDRQTNKAMAWALYGWLCDDVNSSGRRTTSCADELDIRPVSMGGQAEIVKRMLSLINSMEDRLKARESDARKAIADAKSIRNKINAIKINVIGSLDAQLANPG